MKEYFRTLLLFVFLSLVFSSFFGCSGPGTSQNRTGNGSTADGPDSQAANPAAKNSSEYPPIPAAVANSDLRNVDGSTFKVGEKKGKVLLLNLWATWCGPCRSEMPVLVKLQDQYRANGFEVIGLNADDEPADTINKFAAEMNLNYTLAWPDPPVQSSLFNISKFGGIPQSFLIDRKGNLRSVFAGAGPAEIRKMAEQVAKVVNEDAGPRETAAVPAAPPENPGQAPAGDSKQK